MAEPSAKPAKAKPAAAPEKKAAKTAVVEKAPPAPQEKSVKAEKSKKTKMVRDSFTMPHNDYDLIAGINQRLRAAIDAANGDTKVELAFLFDGRVAPIAETSFALKWRVTGPSFQELRNHPACAGALVDARAPELKEVRRWGKKSFGG